MQEQQAAVEYRQGEFRDGSSSSTSSRCDSKSLKGCRSSQLLRYFCKLVQLNVLEMCFCKEHIKYYQ